MNQRLQQQLDNALLRYTQQFGSIENAVSHLDSLSRKLNERRYSQLYVLRLIYSSYGLTADCFYRSNQRGILIDARRVALLTLDNYFNTSVVEVTSLLPFWSAKTVRNQRCIIRQIFTNPVMSKPYAQFLQKHKTIEHKLQIYVRAYRYEQSA